MSIYFAYVVGILSLLYGISLSSKIERSDQRTFGLSYCMQTSSLKWIVFIWVALCFGGCSHQTRSIPFSSSNEVMNSSTVKIDQEFESIAEDFQEQGMEEAFEEGPSTLNLEGLNYIDGILIVNKKYGLPQDYAPGVDPEAQDHVNALIQEMQNQGLNVGWTTSNFRSYEYQTQLYNNYVASYGQEAADTFSARPGFSEHQTGLAFDLTTSTGELITAPTEAQWLLDHAAEYGFIVRYQEGKEAITGYQAEPWHLRYIGERAGEIAASGLTLEEFLNVPGGDYQ